MVTVKEYADSRGKSVQAVYKQIRAKENVVLLENHVFLQKVGNKNTKVMDDEAVKILDEASRQAPTVIIQSDKDEKIHELSKENEALKIKVIDLQEQLIGKADMIITLQEEIRMIEAKKEELPKQPARESLWSRLWNKRNQ